MEGGQRAVETYPSNVLSRANLALYAMYAGQFDLATQEAEQVIRENPNYATAYVPLALSALEAGDAEAARATYNKLAGVQSGTALARLGLADAALYEGDMGQALEILRGAGEAQEIGSRHLQAVARLLAAEAEWQRGGTVEALAHADRAIELSQAPRILFSAGLLRARNQDRNGTMELSLRLSEELESEPRALASLLDGELELATGNPVAALEHFKSARLLADSWWGRLASGRAYLATGRFAEAEADFDQCLARRGEATALFLDDLPTYHLLPQVYQLLGQAREGLGSTEAEDAFAEYRRRRPIEQAAD